MLNGWLAKSHNAIRVARKVTSNRCFQLDEARDVESIHRIDHVSGKKAPTLPRLRFACSRGDDDASASSKAGEHPGEIVVEVDAEDSQPRHQVLIGVYHAREPIGMMPLCCYFH